MHVKAGIAKPKNGNDRADAAGATHVSRTLPAPIAGVINLQKSVGNRQVRSIFDQAGSNKPQTGTDIKAREELFAGYPAAGDPEDRVRLLKSGSDKIGATAAAGVATEQRSVKRREHYSVFEKSDASPFLMQKVMSNQALRRWAQGAEGQENIKIGPANTHGPARVQRACGSREIGPTPSSCNLVAKSPAGTRYLFKGGCDTFEAGQQALLASAAASLPAGATVDILGLASSDGAADFNRSLSCHRAEAARNIFATAGKSSQIAQVEARGAVPGTDQDVNFRAVDIVIHGPAPRPPTPAPPTPVPPAPSIPVPSCSCPAANPACPSVYCAPMSPTQATFSRSAMGYQLIGVLTALGGTEVGAIYSDFVWGGYSGIMTLSSALRTEFATICQTELATNHLMTAVINAIWGRYSSSTPAARIPLSAIAPVAVADIDTPGNPHELVYCGATNAPGLLAGGVGKTQLTTPIGAIPSPQNDARIATGYIDVSRGSLPGGGTRLEFTPTIQIEVRDTVDFCPGNCGDLAAQAATVPFSRWEASGISGDVPFVTQFDAPRSQLRKIVLETTGGVDHWSLEPL